MWNLVLFLFGVTSVLVLYYLYEEEEEEEEEVKGSASRPVTPLKSYEHRFSVSSIFSTNSYESLLERFNSFEEVIRACKEAGLSNCNFILGIDFTASNEWQGKKTFGQACLHKLSGSKVHNPYQKVIWVLGQTLSSFDEDGIIPAFGFGDFECRNKRVFALSATEDWCQGFNDVLDCYNKTCQNIYYGGPSSLAPIIQKAIEIVSCKMTFHILVIITDGQLNKDDIQLTSQSFISASKYPISIVLIGVGDGPWNDMHDLERTVQEKSIFNNMRFVDYHRTIHKAKHPDVLLALNILMDIPDQFKTINELHYIGENYGESIDYDKILALQADRRNWLRRVKQKVHIK